MRTLLLHAAWAALIGCGATAGTHTAPAPAIRQWQDAQGFTNHRLQVGDTWVHAIEYGGDGPPLVFLAGLGNSAHVFDDFAPRFTDQHRVVALTRRGYGESGRPSNGFETGRLVEDLREALDALGLTRVTLVAHSVGGDELTGFAVRYPHRVAGLVYLDAAYDRHGMTGRLIQRFLLNQLPPSAPKPRGRDTASPTAFRAWLAQIYGVEWPMSEVRATRRFDAGGKYQGDSTSGSTGFKIMRGEEAMAWERVRAPLLAIYAVDRSIERDYPWIRRMTIGRGFKQLDAWRASGAQDRFEREQRQRLRRERPEARIVELRDASHYLFISHPARVEAEMRSFLQGASRAESSGGHPGRTA